MRRDLIVSFLCSVPADILGMCHDKPLTLCCPVQQTPVEGYPGGRKGYQKWLGEHADGSQNLVPALAAEAGLPPGDEIGRVAVLGFSNGCIGVWELLRAPDAFRIDAALFIDGIHGSCGWDGAMTPSLYKPVANFGAHTTQNNPETNPDAPVCIITHSSIGPIMRKEPSGRIVASSPSTTSTADLIWQLASSVAPRSYLSPDCGYGCVPALHLERMVSEYADPVKICNKRGCFRWRGIEDGWYDRRGANNLFVLGWGEVEGGIARTRDPAGTADHLFQARVVLPAVVEEFIVRRWNRQCFYVATSGLGADAPVFSACKLGEGTAYADSDAGPHDYFPDLNDSPPPPPCPVPPPGGLLVGAPDDPCHIVGAQPPPPRVEEPAAGLSTSSFLWGAAGFAGGFWLLSRAWR